MAEIRNIVLVHGGFVDGSGWQPVHKILTGEGFNVRNPPITDSGLRVRL